MRPHPGHEHAVPVPQGLLPERQAEALTGVLFIPSPGVVHQHIKTALFPLYPCEESFDLGILRMVTAYRNTGAATGSHRFRGLFDPTLTPARYTTGVIINKIIAYEVSALRACL
jgi:hypothetical protein